VDADARMALFVAECRQAILAYFDERHDKVAEAARKRACERSFLACLLQLSDANDAESAQKHAISQRQAVLSSVSGSVDGLADKASAMRLMAARLITPREHTSHGLAAPRSRTMDPGAQACVNLVAEAKSAN